MEAIAVVLTTKVMRVLTPYVKRGFEKLIEDNSFKTELDGLLKEIGPIIEIFQDVKVVEGKLIGIDVNENSRGKVKVTQKSDTIMEKGEVTEKKVKKD